MKFKAFLLTFLFLGGIALAQNRWAGKKVAVIGDSISDSTRVGTTRCWWEILSDSLLLEPTCYARNGATIQNMHGQVEKARAEQKARGKAWDLILIFGGTNDYNANVPLGEIYTVKEETTNKDGKQQTLLHRSFNTDNATFCGRVNNLLSEIKKHFPQARVLMLSPIHRGYATFGERNVQPDELWANTLGLFLDDYIHCLGQAGRAWAVPMLDTHIHTQIFPIYGSYDGHIHRVDTDRLHPNVKGHHQIALSVQGYLEHTLPFE